MLHYIAPLTRLLDLFKGDISSELYYEEITLHSDTFDSSSIFIRCAVKPRPLGRGGCQQYNIEVENIIDTKSFFYRHDFDEKAVQEVFKQLRKDLGLLDVDDDVIAQLLDESISVWDNDFNYSHSYDDEVS